MAIYRVLKRLDRGSKGILECGTLISDQNFGPNYIDRLVDVEAIAQVSAPPLSALPGWDERDEVLSSIGITTADQLLEANDEGLMRALEIDAIKLAQLRADVTDWLTVKDLKKC